VNRHAQRRGQDVTVAVPLAGEGFYFSWHLDEILKSPAQRLGYFRVESAKVLK
jgi:hypothetical protein